MSRARTLIRGGAQSGLGVLAGMAALLVVGKLLAARLDVAEVGVFGALLACSDVLVALLGLGLPAALPKLVAESSGAPQRRIAASSLAVTAAAAAAAAAAVWAAAWAAPPQSLPASPAWDFARAAWAHVWPLPLLTAAGLLREALAAALAGLGRYRARARALIAVAVAQALFAGGVLAAGRGIDAVLLAMAAAQGVGLTMMAAALPRLSPGDWDRAAAARCVRFSAPLFLNGVLGAVYFRLDVIVVGAMLGPHASGLFEMMKRIALLLSRVLGAMLVPLLPALSETLAAGDGAGAARLAQRTALSMGFAGFGAALAIVCIELPLIDALFSPAYREGAPVLWMVLVAQTLAVLAGVAGQTLIAMGRPALVTLSNVALVAVTLGLDAVLLPRIGLAGAGWGCLAGIACSLVLQTHLARRGGAAPAWGAALRPLAALLPPLLWLETAGSAIAWRLPALPAFVILCFAFGVVTPAQLAHVAAALRAPERPARP